MTWYVKMHEDFERTGLLKYLFTFERQFDGFQWTFDFENGYGASVISHKYSYGGKEGLFEVAPLAVSGASHTITASVPTLEDNQEVYGYLSQKEVIDLCKKILSSHKFTPDSYLNSIVRGD